MKKVKLLQALLILSNLMVVASCNEPTNSSPADGSTPEVPSTPTVSTPEESSTPEASIDFYLNDKVVTYDGTKHSLAVENLPEGAVVKYKNNDQVEPGRYTVTATVSLKDGTKHELEALLHIEKMESTLTAEAVQSAIHDGKGAVPTYTIDNDEQKINVQPIITPGSYDLILVATESAHYKESAPVKVKFDVSIANSLGVVFESKDFIVDGSEKKIEASNVPAGYHVEYENNTATKQGKYNAVCKVYDESDQLKLTLNAVMTLDNNENAEFDQYLKEFFVDYLDGDYLSMNIFMENPENFGFIRDVTDEAKWYTYEPYGDNYMAESHAEMNEYYDMLKAFKDVDKSYSQQISYQVLDDFFHYELMASAPDSLYSPYANVTYIDQFGGYAADFGTYMESYQFRTEQDIKDCLSYIKSLPEAFASYVEFGEDKATAGYPFSDYTLNEMQGYLDDVVSQGEEYYLTQFLVNKLNGCSYLSEEQKGTYETTFKQYMKDYFLVAFEQLSEGIDTLKGKCTKEGYYASYGETGKFMYKFRLQNLLGYRELDMDAYGEYLKGKIEEYTDSINAVVAKIQRYSGPTYNRIMGFLNNGNSVVGLTDPYDMIGYLKTFASTIVPTLEETPEIDVKYMDEAAAEVSNATAYYMKSPLDNTGKEYITLNMKNLGADYNDTLSTMAHEGYPGHLYAYLYDKSLGLSDIATIMTSTAHGEGWATYVSLKLFQYMKKNNAYSSNMNDKNAVNAYCDYLYYNDLLAYTMYTYVDYGIHWLGWDTSNIMSVMGEAGFNDSAETALSMFRTLIEMPSQYAAYGYGMCHFVDIHDEAKERLGDLYSEVEFNAAILSHGWCSYDMLDDVIEEYITQTLHKCSVVEATTEESE